MITDSKVVPKHVPPDVKAAVFWLKNRAQTKWRDDQQVLGGGNATPFDDLTDAQLRELLTRSGLVPAANPLAELEIHPQPPEVDDVIETTND